MSNKGTSKPVYHGASHAIKYTYAGGSNMWCQGPGSHSSPVLLRQVIKRILSAQPVKTQLAVRGMVFPPIQPLALVWIAIVFGN